MQRRHLALIGAQASTEQPPERRATFRDLGGAALAALRYALKLELRLQPLE
jgi:hypothetical protein